MTSVPFSSDSVVPIDSIAPGVSGLRIVFVNVFGIAHGTGAGAGAWTLIDAGLPFSASYIRSWAKEKFGTPPEAILLTHGHFDHVSAAKELAEEWQVPVYAHAQEFPYLNGRESYPAPNVGAGGGLMSWLSPLYPRGPVDLGTRLHEFPLDQDGSAALLPDWQVIPTPGHTPGHVSFFRPADRLLLAGDAFCTTKPESFFEAALAQQPALYGPPAYFTWNTEIAAQSIQRLAGLQPNLVAPGHGHPLAGQEVAEKMARFAQEFAATRSNAA